MTLAVRMVKIWLISGHILKVEPIGFADRSNVDCERSKDDSEMCVLSSRKNDGAIN